MLSPLRTCLIVVLLLGVGCSSAARAAEVSWLTTLECNRRADVVREAEALLGGPLAAVDAVDFTVEVQRHGPQDLRLVLRTGTPQRRDLSGTRILRGTSCDQLVAAASVVIAPAAANHSLEATPAAELRADRFR